MNEPAAPSLEVAFQVIDAITRVKGVIGALLMDLDGQIIAQDFKSQDDQKHGWSAGKTLSDQLAKAAAGLKLGTMNELHLQTGKLTFRMTRHERAWLVVLGEESVNLGMLNLEIRDREELLNALGGGVPAEQRNTEYERIISRLKADGTAAKLIQERGEEIVALRTLHGMLFQTALQAGVSREVISRRINDINYHIYRDSLLDIGFDFFNRKALDNYDPALGRKVMRAQIEGLSAMVLEKVRT